MIFGRRERVIRRILVVEDEPLVAFDTEQLVGDAGYEVVATVDSLAAACKVIESEKLDLVLTDLGLRGDGDGIGVARFARERAVPVLFVTSQNIEDGPSMALGRLAKPYSAKVLETALDVLNEHLQGHRSRNVPHQLTFYDPIVT